MTAFDLTTATLFHPSNGEESCKGVIGEIRTSGLHDLLEDFDTEGFAQKHSLTGKHVRMRVDLINAELERRAEAKAKKQSHRVRSEETNLYADLGDEDES